MNKTETLRSLGFSDRFLESIESYNAKSVEFESSDIGDFEVTTIVDTNNLIIDELGAETDNLFISEK